MCQCCQVVVQLACHHLSDVLIIFVIFDLAEATLEEKELMQKELRDRDRDQQQEEQRRHGSAHSSRGGSSHSHRSRNRYTVDDGNDNDSDNDVNGHLDDDGIDAPTFTFERPLSSTTASSSRLEQSRSNLNSAGGSDVTFSQSQRKEAASLSRPPSKSGSRPASSSSQRDGGIRLSSAGSTGSGSSSSRYHSEFMRNQFENNDSNSRPPTSSGKSDRSHTELSTGAAAKNEAEALSRPQSKQSRGGSRPTSSHSHASVHSTPSPLSLSRPSSSRSGSERGTEKDSDSRSRKGSKSKWDTSHQNKEATTEALRKQSSSRKVYNDEDERHDVDEDSLEDNDEGVGEGAFYEQQYNDPQTSQNHEEGVGEGAFYEQQYNDQQTSQNHEEGVGEGAFYEQQYNDQQTSQNLDSSDYQAGEFDQYGYDHDGFDQYGYDHDGFDHYGYNQEGYDREGKLYEEEGGTHIQDEAVVE